MVCSKRFVDESKFCVLNIVCVAFVVVMKVLVSVNGEKVVVLVVFLAVVIVFVVDVVVVVEAFVICYL